MFSRRWRVVAEAPTTIRRAADKGSLEPEAFPRVPAADFTVFRAVCRDTLPSDEFARVDAVYRDAHRRARLWLRHRGTAGPGPPTGLPELPDEGDVVALLRDLTVDDRSSRQRLTRVRAVQAALFTAGVLLTVDPPLTSTVDPLLAERVGIPLPVLRALDDAGIAASVTLGMIQRLCHTLDLDLADLFEDASSRVGPAGGMIEPARGDAGESSGVAPADDVRLEAALAGAGADLPRHELARALGWPLPRLDIALDTLQRRLSGTGCRLERIGHDHYRLAPRLAVLSDDERDRLYRARRLHHPLTREHAAALLATARGYATRAWFAEHLDEGDHVVADLVRQGLVDWNTPGSMLTADVDYSLYPET